MNYYLKIIEKNDAGWLQPTTQDHSTGSTLNLLTPPDVPGWFAVPSPQFNAPWYGLLLLPNNHETNLIKFHMGRFDPSARPYQWKVKFQIIRVPTIGVFGERNGEEAVTDIIEETGLWYGDSFDLTLLVKEGMPCPDTIRINRVRYQEWKRLTGRP